GYTYGRPAVGSRCGMGKVITKGQPVPSGLVSLVLRTPNAPKCPPAGHDRLRMHMHLFPTFRGREKNCPWLTGLRISANFGLPMLRPLLLPLGLLAGLYGMAQPAARIVFNSAATTVNQHPFVVFNPEPDPVANPGTYLVIDNPNANAITLVGAVISNVPIINSETAQNKIRGARGARPGTYVVPFPTGSPAAGVAMPLTVQRASAGTGAGSIIFSTYDTVGEVGAAGTVNTGWNNELYRPTDVTHVNDYLTGLT